MPLVLEYDATDRQKEFDALGLQVNYLCGQHYLEYDERVATLCTYVGCTALASVPQLDNSGRPWANLCAAHAAEVKASITSGDARRLLSDWVKAQGGAKKAAARL